MYSFYGGRPGNSFVIVTTFRSVADMVEAFSKGSDYTAVRFDEHVMINSSNKNDPDNGKIYRRGYDFNDEMGGAEYIGTVAGPAGDAPQLGMATISEINNMVTQEGFEEKRTEGSYTVTNASLVPGKNGNTYNDSISWATYSFKDPDGTETTAYIGFTFPYPVIDFETTDVPSTAQSSVTRIDDQTHPFYEKWRFFIPRGSKGDSFSNLQVITASNNDGVESYTGQADDRNNSREILVYDLIDSEAGTTKRIYLGAYNMIKDISLNNGTLTIQYTHDANKVIQGALKSISNVTLDSNGTMHINYNDQTSTSLPNAIKSISSIDIQSGTQQLQIHYNDGTTSTIGAVNYIIQGALNTQGDLLVRYADPAQRGNISWNNKNDWSKIGQIDASVTVSEISDIAIDSSGNMTITYQDQTIKTIEHAIKSISSVTIDPNHRLVINYNYGNPDVITNPFKSIIDTYIQTESSQGAGEGTGDQKLRVVYDDGLVPVAIGDPINYIMETAINDEGHLLVWYSDPVHRANGISYNNKTGWADLGLIASKTAQFYNGTDWINVPSDSSKIYVKTLASDTFLTRIGSIVILSLHGQGTFTPANNLTFTRTFKNAIPYGYRPYKVETGPIMINVSSSQVSDEKIACIAYITTNNSQYQTGFGDYKSPTVEDPDCRNSIMIVTNKKHYDSGHTYGNFTWITTDPLPVDYDGAPNS